MGLAAYFRALIYIIMMMTFIALVFIFLNLIHGKGEKEEGSK